MIPIIFFVPLDVLDNPKARATRVSWLTTGWLLWILFGIQKTQQTMPSLLNPGT
jgi:hypothetical protein